MTIQIDTREKSKAIQKILRTFDDFGVDYYSSKLYVGDYMNTKNPLVVVDRKQNLSEICSNVCQDHERLKAELIRAKEHGFKVIILCEHGDGIECLEDVIYWVNPRKKTSEKAMSGDVLYKILSTISRKYDVDFVFCDKNNTGRYILRLLNEHERD